MTRNTNQYVFIIRRKYVILISQAKIDQLVKKDLQKVTIFTSFLKVFFMFNIGPDHVQVNSMAVALTFSLQFTFNCNSFVHDPAPTLPNFILPLHMENCNERTD